MDIESARLLSPPVRAMRAKIVAFMLEFNFMGCLDLDDVIRELRAKHMACTRSYLSRGVAETVPGLGFLLMDNVHDISADYHHVDSWAQIVASMDGASQASYYNNLPSVAIPNALPASPEYQNDRQQRDENMNGVITEMVNDFKAYFTRYPADEERIENMAELYALGDRIVGPDQLLRLAAFHRACAMRREAGDDEEARGIWRWFWDHTVFGVAANRAGLLGVLVHKVRALGRAAPAAP